MNEPEQGDTERAPRGQEQGPAPVRDVVVLHWPEDAAQVKRLSAARLPRLLFVGPGADPPEGGDCEEDWVRLPADDGDVRARLSALSRRASRHQAHPEVDVHGRLLHRGRWVSLPPIDQRLLRLLVERFGAVVPTEELVRGAWDEPPTPNALRVHLTRLRQRLAPLGLQLRNVYNTGVVLEENLHDDR